MKVYAITDIGRMRPINEDSYYAPADGERFCAVADGMGGHNAGEVASALAVEVFSRSMRQVEHITAQTLHAAVEQANDSVFQMAQENAGMSGMGTTFSALAAQDDTAYLAHVGDSRIYLVRNGAIMQVTTDIITRALGTELKVEIDIVQMSLRPGDVFFLCSDGMTNYVDEREILRAAVSERDWQDKLKHLVSIALENGGADNITALFAVFEEAANR